MKLWTVYELNKVLKVAKIKQDKNYIELKSLYSIVKNYSDLYFELLKNKNEYDETIKNLYSLIVDKHDELDSNYRTIQLIEKLIILDDNENIEKFICTCCKGTGEYENWVCQNCKGIGINIGMQFIDADNIINWSNDD